MLKIMKRCLNLPNLRPKYYRFIFSGHNVYYNIINPLECKGNYSATSNNMKLIHWPLMGGLSHSNALRRPGGQKDSRLLPGETCINISPYNQRCGIGMGTIRIPRVPWYSHENWSDNDYIMGIGMGVKVWEWEQSCGNGNEFPLQLFNVSYEILFSELGKHSHLNFTLARPSPERVIFTSLMSTVTD